jgi:uncharacterized OB-fold protein
VTTKTRVPAIDGWFTLDDEAPALLATRCTACGSYFFPRESYLCRNPGCSNRELEEVPLSRRGRVWSFTNTHYQPPPPYVPVTDPFEPFALAAVELDAEGLVVLGQVVPGVGVEDLAVGTEVELVLGTLYTDDDHEYVTWKWQPVAVGS